MRRMRFSTGAEIGLIGALLLLAVPASPEPVVEAARLDKRLVPTPLAGLGNHFLIEGARIERAMTIDPRLVIAIAGAESTFGKRICTPHNAWNWFWEGPCFPRKADGTTRSPFVSWKRGAEVVSKFLKRSYLLKGYTTIPLIGSKYCVDGCEHWEGLVTRFYTELGGDTTDLTYPHVPPALTDEDINRDPANPPGGGTTKTDPIPPTEKPATDPSKPADPVVPPPAKDAAPVSERTDDPAVPMWLWGGIALACAGVIGATGFLIGRRAR